MKGMFDMKKALIIAGLIAVLSVSGCNVAKEHDENTDIINPPEEQTDNVVVDNHTKSIQISSQPSDVSLFEPMGKYEGGITKNENDDLITLYTSATRGDDGQMQWDDSQEWILQVETDDGVYELYNERIQGNVYMSVSDYFSDKGDKSVITLFIVTNTSNEVREYSYSDKSFEERITYTTNDFANEGINPLYSSIPQYR